MTQATNKDMRMAIMTELKTCAVIPMMILAVTKGKNESSMNSDTKKAMRLASMTVLPIVIMIQKRRNENEGMILT